MHDEKRASYLPITDTEAMEAFKQLSRTEGIIPAIESAHAVAAAVKVAQDRPGCTMIINISGRGDKDVDTAAKWFGLVDPDATQDAQLGGHDEGDEKAQATGSAATDAPTNQEDSK